MSESRKYRKFTAQQKLEIVLAGLRGDRSVKDVCREHQIAETLYYAWREKLLEGGAEHSAGKQGAPGRGRAAQEGRRARARLGAQDLRAGAGGKRIAGVGVRQRVAHARELVAAGHRPAVVARVMQISRQAIYRTPKTPPAAARRARPPVDEVEQAIIEIATDNPTDRHRMVTAWARRALGRPVNRKKVLRVMRQRRLIQRRRVEPRRRRPGFFRVERTGQPVASRYDLDLGGRARVGVSERDHRLLHPRDRWLTAVAALPRREAITVIEQAVADQHIAPGTLKLGTDNGSAFCARATLERSVAPSVDQFVDTVEAMAMTEATIADVVGHVHTHQRLPGKPTSRRSTRASCCSKSTTATVCCRSASLPETRIQPRRPPRRRHVLARPHLLRKPCPSGRASNPTRSMRARATH